MIQCIPVWLWNLTPLHDELVVPAIVNCKWSVVPGLLESHSRLWSNFPSHIHLVESLYCVLLLSFNYIEPRS